jgi:hypothetical protein
MSYNNQKRTSIISSGIGFLSALNDERKRQKSEYNQPYGKSYEQRVASAPPFNPDAQPSVMLDDYPQFTQTVIDSIVLGSKRYFQNMGDQKKYNEIHPILQQIANLPSEILLGKRPLPFKPKSGNFYGYKGGITRRKKNRGKKSRKH